MNDLELRLSNALTAFRGHAKDLAKLRRDLDRAENALDRAVIASAETLLRGANVSAFVYEQNAVVAEADRFRAKAPGMMDAHQAAMEELQRAGLDLSYQQMKGRLG